MEVPNTHYEKLEFINLKEMKPLKTKHNARKGKKYNMEILSL